MAKDMLRKKTKTLFRQIKEGPKWDAAEKKRKAAKKKKKKDWASKYNIGTRDVINKMRGSHVPDKEIKSILGLE